MPLPRLERKKSDFHFGGAVTAYTGSGCCCCCCCLHWVGAAIGGGMGMHKAWVKNEQPESAPYHPKVSHVLKISMLVGFLLNLAPAVLAGVSSRTEFPFEISMLYLGAAAFLPTLVFVPSGLLMVAAATRIRWRLRRVFALEQKIPTPALPKEGGAYREPKELELHEAHDLAALDGFETCCPSCWAPLGKGAYATRCPACEAPIDQPLFREADQGVKAAWGMTLTSCAGSFLGTLAGYAVMVVIGLAFSLLK